MEMRSCTQNLHGGVTLMSVDALIALNCVEERPLTGESRGLDIPLSSLAMVSDREESITRA
jgi:hypothetical protein